MLIFIFILLVTRVCYLFRLDFVFNLNGFIYLMCLYFLQILLGCGVGIWLLGGNEGCRTTEEEEASNDNFFLKLLI